MTGIPALLGGLGLVFFVFGLLSVFLLLAGAPTDLYWIVANFVIGVVLLVSAVVTNLDAIRERLASGESRRIGRYGTSAIVQTLVLLFIVGALAFFANRYHKRWDVSEAGVHSLSDQTRKVLEGLEQDVEVVAFYPKVEQPRIRDLLDRYAYESERFQVQYADPNQRPDLVERYEVNPERLGQGIVKVAIGGESVEIEEPDEPKLTNALVKLTRQGQKQVYFVTGHNERPVEGEGADGKEGFGRAAEALRNENYQVATLLLDTVAEVPEDADVVILAGPTRPFQPGDADKLDRYVARGGAVLAMVDPRAQTDFVDTLAGWGARLGDDVIVDYLMSRFGQAMSPLGIPATDHEITRDLRDPALFLVARSVAASDGAALAPIVTTGKDAWAETDLEALFAAEQGRAEPGPDDLPGPVTIGLAGQARPPAAPEDGEPPPALERRLVVFGDSDFASNQGIEAYRNRDLFVNSVNWLLGDVEAIAVRPNKSRASRLMLTTDQFSTIRYVALFVLPQAIAILGVLAWWSRRRAPGR